MKVHDMREMKDSGIDTIGLIPALWTKKRLKYLCTIQTGDEDTQNADPDGDYPFYVRSPIVEKCNRYTFEGEGILVAGDGAGAGRIFHHAYGKYAVHQRVYRLANFVFNPDFMHYYLSNLFPREMDKGSAQSTVPSIRLPMLVNFPFFLPSMNEAEQIVCYLDSKCAEIDALATDIQAEIDTLDSYKQSVITEAVTKGMDKNAPTKASRIFYMAPYHADWRLTKIGYECTKLWRNFAPEDPPLLCTNKGKITIRPEEMSGRMVSEDNAMQGIRKGDIAIHGMDTWHGAIAISDYDGKITRVVHVCDSSNDKRFLVYYLQQLAFNGVYKLISNGVRGNTSDFRSWDKVKDIFIALPEKAEQVAIANYLDDMNRKVDAIIAQKREQLAILADYRKSIIFEYVTGKKEVPPA